MTKRFKVLEGNRAFNAPGFIYDLPTYKSGKWVPGSFTPSIANPSLCYRGYHTTTLKHLHFWMKTWRWNALTVWEVKVKGKTIRDDDKAVHSSIQLVRPIAPEDLVVALRRKAVMTHAPSALTKVWSADGSAKVFCRLQVKERRERRVRALRERLHEQVTSLKWFQKRSARLEKQIAVLKKRLKEVR
jgi:hypothetical protein